MDPDQWWFVKLYGLSPVWTDCVNQRGYPFHSDEQPRQNWLVRKPDVCDFHLFICGMKSRPGATVCGTKSEQAFEPCSHSIHASCRKPAWSLCLIALIVSFSGYSETTVPPNPPHWPSDYLMGCVRLLWGVWWWGGIIGKCFTLNPNLCLYQQ